MSTPPSWGIGRSRVAAVDHPNDPRGGMYCTTTGSGRGQRRDMVCLAEVGNGIEHQQRLDAGHERIHCCCTAADVGIDIGDDQLAASHRCIRSRRSVLTNAPYRSLREHGVHRPRSKSRHDSGVRWRTGEPGALSQQARLSEAKWRGSPGSNGVFWSVEALAIGPTTERSVVCAARSGKAQMSSIFRHAWRFGAIQSARSMLE